MATRLREGVGSEQVQKVTWPSQEAAGDTRDSFLGECGQLVFELLVPVLVLGLGR